MNILQDLKANSGDRKAQLVMLAFRSTALVNNSRATPAKVLSRPIGFVYRVIVDWVLGVEIPWQTPVGPGLRLQHAQGIVINGNSNIGRDVSIHQGVTIGGRETGSDCPSIGDGVRIGAGAIIIGSISIGPGAHIGAGAVVLKDVPAGASAVGNPARIISARSGQAGTRDASERTSENDSA